MKYILYFSITRPFFAQAGFFIRPFQPSNSLHPGRFSHTPHLFEEEAQHVETENRNQETNPLAKSGLLPVFIWPTL